MPAQSSLPLHPLTASISSAPPQPLSLPQPLPHLSIPQLSILDSHTAGEPTRLVLSGGPNLGPGTLQQRFTALREQYPHFRTSVLAEPRGSNVLVGALLCPPDNPSSAAAVIFFNDVGYLGMCGHGTIGLVHSLAHLGRLQPGQHTVETPVGPVSATLHPSGEVTVANVPSWLYAADVSVQLDGQTITGDICWGGNWFFLIHTPPPVPLTLANVSELTQLSTLVRQQLQHSGITGAPDAQGAPIDHIEWSSAPLDPHNHARNFILCPGTAYDRSPCGTGTSAKLASLAARGLLAPGQILRQEGILGTVFSASYQLPDPPDSLSSSVPGHPPHILPSITGRAFVTAQSTLLFEPQDPFATGIPNP